MRPNPVGQVPRIVVVQPAPAAGLPSARLPVAVTTYRAREPRLTVIVKTTFSYRANATTDGPRPARFASRQLGIFLAEPSLALDARADELHYPSDLAPRKAQADLLIVGHAHAVEPTERIEGRVAIGDYERRFIVKSSEPVPAIALALSTLRPEPGGEPVPLGPVRPPGHDDVFHGDSFDYARYNAAHPSQRVDEIDPAATIVLEGLSRGGGSRTVELPGLVPRATVEDPWRGVREVDLRADTLWLDADRELVVLVWRGDLVVVENGREVERIVVWLDRAGHLRTREQVLPHLQRGHIGYAVRAVDLEPDAEPIPTDDDTLRIHRYKTWRSNAPEPELSVEQYATISAELAECADTEQRGAVLEQHGYDEDRWIIEERGWLEKMANEALQGAGTTAALYSAQFVKAQDELGSDDELERSFDDFLDIAVAMVSTAEPAKVLDEHGLTLPMWMRLDRRYQRRMKKRPELAEQYRARLSELEAAEPAMPEELA